MIETLLFLPILIILAGAGLAFAARPLLEARRITITGLSWGLALLPLAAFAWLAAAIPDLLAGETLTWRLAWLPAAGLNVSLYLDSLSLLFALLVTGIGVLVVIYTGYYFHGKQDAWRFLAYIQLFMSAMLGLVLAGDVITLFIFWEGTSITSYLLVAYKYKSKAAQEGAFKALFITAGGGIALLAGLLMVSAVAGGADFAAILSSGEALQQHDLYLVMLGLVAFGAFTKSAQFPAHIWLPAAMSAPTPASAYLHSATMVKAGIYLLARLNPALGGTESWFWLLTVVGGMTMLSGAYLGLQQNDLKALLAYSTITQLGVLVMLIGQETDIAFKALVIGVLAHALYKSALFLVAGIVDHEAGTRDLRRLGGLQAAMPLTFILASVAALSMAGLPPLFGFLAKETLLATAVHPTLPAELAWIFPTASVAAGALLLAQSGLLIWDTFLGRRRDESVRAHEAPSLMLLAPAIPALLSLLISVMPEPAGLATILAKAAEAAFGAEVKVSLALWTGLNVPFFLSLAAISLGSLIFWFRAPIRAWQQDFGQQLSWNAVHTAVLNAIDRAAIRATRLQEGRLRHYLAAILTGTIALVLYFDGGLPWPAEMALTWPAPDFGGELAILRLFALFVTVGAALASVLLRRDLAAIIALGAVGLAIAVLMVLEPAPDVALVQIVVDILAVVILVLALTRLPRAQRRRAQQFTFLQSRSGLVRDGLIAGGIGLVVTAVTLIALLSRPRQSVVTPFYAENAKPLAGATDIVGAIIVDFRALDTFIEIAVFSMAGVGIYTLLRHAARKFGDEDILEIGPLTHRLLPTNGIGGGQTSAFVRALAHLALPLSFLLALTHMMYGHDQPGDGFTAGVIISLAIGFWYVAFGYERTRQQLGWLKSAWLIGSGLLLVVVNGTIAALLNGHFLSPVNFGERWGLPLPQGFYLSTAFLFEVAICLAVVGSVTYMINTLGHPGPRAGEETYEEETAVVAPSPPGGNGGNGYRTPREETAVTES